MKYVLAGCALALCVGSAAMASDQLARQLGVEPGAYTLSELVRIKAAQEEDNDLLQNWAMRRTNTDVVVSTQSIGGAGRMNEQLARAIRVDPSDYTPSELAREFFDKTD
jgi:hypothetical protein